MRIPTLVILTFSLLFTANAQRPDTKPQPQIRPKPMAVKETTNFSGYEFDVNINPDKSISLSIRIGHEYDDIDKAALKKALTEYVSMQTSRPGSKPVGPKVVISSDETVDIGTVIDVAKTAFVSSSAIVSVKTADYVDLELSPEPKPLSDVDIKPNPLTLVVGLTAESKITLNNETEGSLADLAPLLKKLRDVFQERSANGVFREGSYDIEKTVVIELPRTAKFANLNAIAKAVSDAGCDRVVFQIYPGTWTNIRKLLVTS